MLHQFHFLEQVDGNRWMCACRGGFFQNQTITQR